jgi:hypothetical protein
VIWIVPGFTVDGYLPQLAEPHRRIQAGVRFTTHAQRFLIEARKPRLTAECYAALTDGPQRLTSRLRAAYEPPAEGRRQLAS